MAKKPIYKMKCTRCGKYCFIKPSWKQCMPCWEKENGKFKGPDRELYV
ncbi:MAG TPA: hypothetical protein VI564_04180 [Candidatus Nanoarchaeia archaeon]|nr:hypothetical protein [Candidatus Nanoarchaeia archaeon]